MRLCESITDPRAIRFYQGLEERLIEKFNGKYDYSETIYKGKRQKFTYICPNHGNVTQVAGEHTRGKGCLHCRYKETGEKHNAKARENLIARFEEKHGQRFDYSKVNYINDKQKVIVICREHGDFLTSVRDHVKGGCPQCSKESVSRTAEEFINEANGIHNNKFTYLDLPKRVHIKTNLSIKCTLHGLFYMSAISHLRGSGCTLCTQKELRWTRKAYDNQETILYYVKIGTYYKIGLTKRSIIERFSNETVKDTLEIIATWNFKNGGIAFELEQECLKATKQFKTNVLLLRKGGNTVLRTKDVLSIIKPIIEEPFK